MLANDRFSDCTTAAACHMLMCWRLNTQGAVAAAQAASENQALAAYSAVNKNFDANDRTTYPFDTGALLQDVIHSWKRFGIAGVKIDGYGMLAFSDPDSVRRSISAFGACCIGVQLPTVQAQTLSPPTVDQNADWDLSAGQVKAGKDGRLGHCVVGVGYDDEGIDVVSWGIMKRMSWAFYNRYMDESYAVLCAAEWAPGGGPSPGGLTAADLSKVGNELTSMWIT